MLPEYATDDQRSMDRIIQAMRTMPLIGGVGLPKYGFNVTLEQLAEMMEKVRDKLRDHSTKCADRDYELEAFHKVVTSLAWFQSMIYDAMENHPPKTPPDSQREAFTAHMGMLATKIKEEMEAVGLPTRPEVKKKPRTKR